MTGNVSSRHDWRKVPIEGYVDLIGPLLSRREEGRKIYGLHTGQQHQNALGSVHGGVITGLLDQVIAMEAWKAADRQPTVTVQMDTRFISAAKSGDLIEAHATIRHGSGSMMFVDADLVSGDRLVATATAVMKIVRKAD